MPVFVAWLIGIVAGAVIAVAVFVIAAWAVGGSADLAPTALSISLIIGIAAGARVAVGIKRRLAPGAVSIK